MTTSSRRATSTARSTSTAASSTRSPSRRSRDQDWERERDAVRVWQPGSSLVSHKQVKVDDWSWAATRRRLTALYRLAPPYRRRVLLAIGTLLLATAASLAPPLLIGRAVDTVKDGNVGP